MFKEVILIIGLANIAWAARSLRFLSEIVTTGAVTPSDYTYYPNPYPDYLENLDPGEETPVGYRQHYLIGKQLRKDYQDFFDAIQINQQQVAVRSRMGNKTFESAQVHLDGLFTRDTIIPFSDEKDQRYRPDFAGIEDEDVV